MPKVTIWIKNEDLDKWNAIADRPAWLHEHLDMPKATKDGYRSEHFYSVPGEVKLTFPEQVNMKDADGKYPWDNPTYKKVKEVLDSGALDDPTYTDMEDTP